MHVYATRTAAGGAAAGGTARVPREAAVAQALSWPSAEFRLSRIALSISSVGIYILPSIVIAAIHTTGVYDHGAATHDMVC